MRKLVAVILVLGVLAVTIPPLVPGALPAPSALRPCPGPVGRALARPDGTVSGRAAPDGSLVEGPVWLTPIIETPVQGQRGKVEAFLAPRQPAVRLIACHGGRLTIQYPGSEEWPVGTIDAFDRRTCEPTVVPYALLGPFTPGG
jgi:hypothetical protein